MLHSTLNFANVFYCRIDSLIHCFPRSYFHGSATIICRSHGATQDDQSTETTSAHVNSKRNHGFVRDMIADVKKDFQRIAEGHGSKAREEHQLIDMLHKKRKDTFGIYSSRWSALFGPELCQR